MDLQCVECEELRYGVGGSGAGEVESLGDFAAESGEDVDLVLCFHAFDDDAELQGVGDGDD